MTNEEKANYPLGLKSNAPRMQSATEQSITDDDPDMKRMQRRESKAEWQR